MNLTFTRSGGFAGPATTIKGVVAFRDDAAMVTSDFGYRRDLAPQEVQTLRGILRQLPGQQAPSRQLPDQFQYDIAVTWEDGRVQSLTVYDDTSPAIHNLLDWVRNECDRIWSHRINQ